MHSNTCTCMAKYILIALHSVQHNHEKGVINSPVDPVYVRPPHCPYSGTVPVADEVALAEVEVEVELVVIDFEVVALVPVELEVELLLVVDVNAVLGLTKNATVSCAATVTV